MYAFESLRKPKIIKLYIRSSPKVILLDTQLKEKPHMYDMTCELISGSFGRIFEISEIVNIKFY